VNGQIFVERKYQNLDSNRQQRKLPADGSSFGRLRTSLGSVTTTLWADGAVRANLRYFPFGKQR
jgi:hypothetical protein